MPDYYVLDFKIHDYSYNMSYQVDSTYNNIIAAALWRPTYDIAFLKNDLFGIKRISPQFSHFSM